MLLRQCFRSLTARPAAVSKLAGAGLRMGSFRFSSTEAAKRAPEASPAALTEEYKQEISDLWETYAMRQARRQCLVGTVTSTKNSKSITVTVTRQKLVKKYRKWISSRKRFMAHDASEQANVGDLVRIVPCRPMSKKKRHQLMDVLIAEGQLPSKHDHEKNLALLQALDPVVEEESKL